MSNQFQNSNFKLANTFLILFTAIIVCGGLILIYRYRHPKYIPLAPRAEIDVTIIPGRNLSQIASDWRKLEVIQNEKDLFFASTSLISVSSTLLNEKPTTATLEGYLFPDTYRVYKDAKLSDLLDKIFLNLETKITAEMREKIKKQNKSFFEILTLASIVEKEGRNAEEMGIIADIFWRRLKINWALQSCASVNYITGKSSPAVSATDKSIDSPYNTYKYRGLPPGPISNPGLIAIKAIVYPTKNNYWYFMTGNDGVMRYAKTLEEHNMNVAKYLR